MSEQTSPYVVSSIAAATVSVVESFTEIRCPACVPLGWESSRLLFKVNGVLHSSGAVLQIRCHRCKSLISWELGTPHLWAVEKGPKNDKRQKYTPE